MLFFTFSSLAGSEENLVKTLDNGSESGIVQTGDRVAPENAVFAGKHDVAWHFNKHIDDFIGVGESEHLQEARELLSAPLQDGIIEKCTRSDRSISRHDFVNNRFVGTLPEGNIRTYFKPKELAEYWRKEHERNK